MKKKVVSLLLASTMVLSMAACGREVPPATGETSSEVTSESTTEEGTEEVEPQGLVPEEGAELIFWASRPAFGEEIAAAFEEEYGIPVTVEEVGFDSTSKLMLEGPAGNAADVVWGSHQVLSTVVNAGVVLPVDESLASIMREEMQDAAIQSATIDGTMYAFPFAIETTAIAYNKDLVETPATSYEQIFEEAAAFNNPEENMFYYLNTIGGYTQYPLLSAGGFELHGADGMDNDNPGYNTPGFEKGLEYVAAMGDAMPIDSADLTMAGGQFLEQNFIEGKTAYYQVGPWSIAALDEAGVNYGLIAHPTMGGEDAKPLAGVTLNYVNYYTEYPNAAQLFAAYCVSPEAAALLYTTDKNITARADYAEIEGLKHDENLLMFAEAFKTAVPQSAVPRMSYYWTIMDSVLSSVFDGDLTPAEGAAKAQADFDALVASE